MKASSVITTTTLVVLLVVFGTVCPAVADVGVFSIAQTDLFRCVPLGSSACHLPP